MIGATEESRSDPGGGRRGRGRHGPPHRSPEGRGGRGGGRSRGGEGGNRHQGDHPGHDTDDRTEHEFRRGRGRRGFGRPGGWQQVDLPSADDARAWFTGRLPADWFSDLDVTVDREEIVVVGTLASTDGLDDAEAEGRISRFRADSRDTRMEIAEEAQERYRRKVSWGAKVGDVRELFTNISVPVMTRLKQPERQVLDTLVDSGVARSRSEALSWAVRLVGEHTENWLADLRTAMSEVDKLRSEGPDLS